MSTVQQSDQNDKESAGNVTKSDPDDAEFDEQLDHPSKEFLEIFEKLDPTINGELIEKAWKQFDTVGQQVILEGQRKAWMTCAFYTTVWQSTPLGQETICKYSVSKLLNICDLSVLEFFEKLNKWAEMIVASRRLLDHINRVQSSLAVSTVVYKKFLPIFRRVFFNANRTKPSPTRAAKRDANSLQHLTLTNTLEFIWLMFIALKKQFILSGDDLINSYHLLLCIVELVFEDVFAANLTHLFNPEFVKLVNREGSDSSVLENLCSSFNGVILDAKHLRAHWLFPRLRKLTDEGVLISSGDDGGFLSNFAANKSAFDSLYEDAMLKKAEVDERIFIRSATDNIDTIINEALDASAIIMLRRCNLDSNWAIDAELLLRMSTQNCIEKLNSQRAWQIPPSAKSYVLTPEQFCPTASELSSGGSHKVQKLSSLIAIDFRQTDNDFDHLLSLSRENSRGFIADQVAILNDKLERAIEQGRTERPAVFNDALCALIKQHKEDIELLFYRLLQHVVLHERARSFNNGIEMTGDANVFFLSILQRIDFLASLWVTSLELMLFSYDSCLEFPWSCNVAAVAPVNFYKIIELVVRAEPELSREMVKHLNKIEERVLEELAWTIDSPLWGALARYSEFGIPSCKAVSLTSSTAGYNPTQRGNQFADSYNNASADGPTLVSRYSSSPMKPFDRVPVKRRLDYDSYGDVSVEDEEVHVESGEPIRGLPPRAKRAAPEEPVGDYSEYVQPRTALILPSSFIVFFRKVYYLSAVRLTDLCDRIRIDEAGRQKVWTLFEYILRNETTLMTGRHLDQNLMCCLYIISKVCALDTSFHDIMYHYRHQPQALSRVYRRVLIDPSVSPTTAHFSDDGASRDSVTSVSGGKLRSNSALPTPDMTSAPPTPEPHNVDYADLIKYYNRVFVARVEDFVKRFTPSNTDSKENMLMLIAMPKVYCNSLSPRRLVNDQINVLPMSSVTSLPGRPARYNFNRSPSKDLKNINAMVRGAQVTTPHGY